MHITRAISQFVQYIWKSFFNSESDLISSVVFMIFLLPFVHWQGASVGAKDFALQETIHYRKSSSKCYHNVKLSFSPMYLVCLK